MLEGVQWKASSVFALASTSSCILCKIGRSQSSNLQYVSFGTSKFPILFKPFGLKSLPLNAKSPILCGARHFIKSSSIPPPVVTSTSTCLCCTRYLMTSLTPDEIMFEVYARNIFAFVFLLTSGLLKSSSSFSVIGTSDKRQARILSISFTASPIFVAWKPVVSNLAQRPSRERSLSKSGPWHAAVSFSSLSSDFCRTAAATMPGMAAIFQRCAPRRAVAVPCCACSADCLMRDFA